MSANAEPPAAHAQATPGLADLSQQIASARAQSATAPAGGNEAGPHAPGAGEVHDPTPGATSRRPWLDRIGAAMSRSGTELSRPPVRLAATGVLLLVIALVLVPSSVWTLPLVIVGALMVLIAWIGSRLHGHVRVEWGETGAQVHFHAQVASAGTRTEGLRFTRKVFNNTSLTVWTRQLAGLVGAGLPLERALTALGEEAEDPRQRELVAHLKSEVNGGSPFARALSSAPREFDEVYRGDPAYVRPLDLELKERAEAEEDDAAATVLDRFTEVGLINDAALAANFAAARHAERLESSPPRPAGTPGADG